MASMNSYAHHAEVWGFFSGDRTQETAFWSALAGKYGAKVLALMAATGEMGAALARKGYSVTAVDLIPEMVAEGRRRYAYLPGLRFAVGDITALQLEPASYDFAFASDFNHLMTPEAFRAALRSVAGHLRPGGGLALDLWQPGETSWESPWRRFDPYHPSTPDLTPTFSQAWKEGRTIYDAQTRRVIIEQEVYIQHEDAVEQFSHNLTLQIYTREAIAAFLHETGYRITSEYGGYGLSPWSPGAEKWIVEAVKG